jgi:transglutaminase-like putative cysteine protease
MPRLDFWRRLFHHSALGLASACILYAEAFFLPGPLLVSLYLLAGVQVLAFAAEGRHWVLPSWAGNLLAGAVAGGGVAWIAEELNRPDSVLASLPLPAGLLPYIGPILIGLLVIKLFRPPTPRDFWLLQGVGALQVALACVLATNPESGLLFGGLLAAYLACVLGRLALHYFEEEQRLIISPPPRGRGNLTGERMPFAYLMSPFCLLWSLAVVAVAAPLFLLTPRIKGPPWDSSVMAPGQRAGVLGDHAGFSQHIDLNRDGPVRLTDEEVFRVAVENDFGQPPLALPDDQHWRGGVLDTYDRGRWANQELKRQSYPNERASPPAPPEASGIYRLKFKVGPGAGGFFLAEPVFAGHDSPRSTSVDAFDLPERIPLVVNTRGPVLPRLYSGQHDYTYRQTVDAANNADRIPANESVLYIQDLTHPNVPQLAEWTTALLNRLAAKSAYGLSPHDIRDVKAVDAIASLPAEKHERVGQALTAYLSNSGEYGYTLDLRRQDTYLDPVMDFLVNTKQGHCERFASALALMLRSQGIPSRIVVGFRGAVDPVKGVYVIRQNQAHAWVQMFARHPGAEYRHDEWITLDPTPPAESTAPIPYSLWEWWRDEQRTGQELWGGLVVNYNAEEQADLWTRFRSPFVMTALKAGGLTLLVLAASGALTWVGSRRRRRASQQRGPAAATAGYARLLALLARHARLKPKIGQTPREFAGAGRRFLLALPAAQSFADLPDEIVDRLYLVRFGGQSLTAGDNTAIAAALDQLAVTLKRGGG